MSEPEHTPLPWEVDKTGRFYAPCIRHNGMIVVYLPPAPASHSANAIKDLKRAEADADLIETAANNYHVTLKALQMLWAEVEAANDEGRSVELSVDEIQQIESVQDIDSCFYHNGAIICQNIKAK